jgi:hypothetical protein
MLWLAPLAYRLLALTRRKGDQNELIQHQLKRINPPQSVEVGGLAGRQLSLGGYNSGYRVKYG